ncbi:SWF/SNF helicase family protein [Oscillospiraceae bacterium OttesenSCG-928-F05]|nr:SWF/SNF helicase family protein [Oscillospiraceae bacterium OttesenSCG-928-F05]
MRGLAENIGTSGKMSELLRTLKKCFAVLKQRKLPQKALVFVDNLTTLGVLPELLASNGYPVIRSTEQDYIVRFRAEKSAVLIATDAAAKGLDMEFCPLVINYDLLYNAVEMEQRISRCHRQGQQSDVLVINLLSRQNFADVRILELINKRVLQFDGIFGMSDEIVGNFDASIDEIPAKLRKADEIKAAFDANLSAHESDNKRLVAQAEDTLFTTFTKTVADKVAVTPRYIEDKTAKLNDALWQVVCAWFAGRDDYAVDEQARTITLTVDAPQQLFYYWTGSRNKPYTGQKRYGLGKDFKPSGGKIALTSVLAKGIFGEIACADSGEITVDADIEACDIAFYDVSIFKNRAEVATNTALVGKTASGQTLTDDECCVILELPAISCTDTGKATSYWLRNSTGGASPHPLDELVPTDELVHNYASKLDSAAQEEIERIKLRAERRKTALEHSLDDIRAEIKAAKQEQENESGDRLKELTTAKRLKVLEKDLRSREQALFYDQMRVNVAAEDEIAAITGKEQYTVRTRRQFVVKVSGGHQHG